MLKFIFPTCLKDKRFGCFSLDKCLLPTYNHLHATFLMLQKELRKENSKRYGREVGGQPDSKRHRIDSDNLDRNGRTQVTESIQRHFSEPCRVLQSEDGRQEDSFQDPMVKAWINGIRDSNITYGKRCRDDCRPQTIRSEKVKLPVKDRIRIPVGYDDLVD